MSLITGEELARGLLIGIFGGAAGLCTVALPGSALWLLPASIAVGGCALTVPEVRSEAVRLLPDTLPLRTWPGTLRRLPDALRGSLTHQTATPAPSPAPIAQTAPHGADVLRERLEDSPHRLIIGHTRGGKTTLIHHMATTWAAAGERVLVGDPDAAPGLWPGCEVRGHGDDMPGIGELLSIVQAEVTQRRAARADGQRQFAPLHLIIDEAQDVLPSLPGALELFEDVARRGGKLNIRMTVGVQDKQVRTLGLEGKSELLRNFQVADVLKAPDGRRVAVLRDAETGQKIPHAIPTLPNPEDLIIRRAAPATGTTPTRPPAAAPASARRPVSEGEAAALLASMFPDTIPPRQDAEGVAAPTLPRKGRNDEDGHSSVVVEGRDGGGVTVNVTQVAPQSGRTTRDTNSAYNLALVALYRAAGIEGRPFSPLYAQLKGSKEMVFAAWQEGRDGKHPMTK